MDVVITKENTQGHIINKYKFKVLTFGSAVSHEDEKSHLIEASETTQKDASDESDNVFEQHAISSSSRDELVESLLQKTDEMSSNFIKLQMKLEDQENEFKAQLESATKEAYEKGLADAKGALQAEIDAQKEAGIDQLAKSVRTLETSAENFRSGLARIESELVHAAVDIAKEVIVIELHDHASEIAATLASELIHDLQGSAKITLKVNPADHGVISEKVGKLEHVDIISDSAISKGGVIAVSESGNIDSEVMKRYERVKRTALGG